MSHALWVDLHAKIARSYSGGLRTTVWRKLTSHPALAYRLAIKIPHARLTAARCAATGVATLVDHPSGPLGSVAPTGIPGAWQLTWSDEFSEGGLDTSKWTTGWFGSGVTQPINSAEIGAYGPRQVAVDGGTLSLTATAATQVVNGRMYPYTSGLVSTYGKLSFTYGVVEARIYLPGSGGSIANWPAFWADGMGTWPTTGELDVMEGMRGQAAYHFHSPAGGPGADVAGTFTGWHTYAADWQPGVVTYYYDGHRVGSIRTGITNSPMYLILNYGLDNTYGGAIHTPDAMKVDYVRVWH
jgi:beta-glucanase (GH16 family)